MNPARCTLAIVASLLLAACAKTLPPPPAPETRATTTTTSAEPPVSSAPASALACEVHCDTQKVIVSSNEPVDVNAATVANVDNVFAAMHEDLRLCYAERIATDPGAHAFLVVTMVVESTGRVREVETTGGARLGKKAMACIVRRIKGATLNPIPGGGTRRIEVPLYFRRTGIDEST